MNIPNMALSLFLIANPIGNIPAFLSLVKDFDEERQKKILFRESIISFLLAATFLFVGQAFLKTVNVQTYALQISGGILLFVCALQMIFPLEPKKGGSKSPREPFVFPLATPLLAGGGTLATVMIFAETEESLMKVFIAASIAWVFITLVAVSSTLIQRLMGRSGILALEQLMGMMLAMMSTELVVKGIIKYIQVVSS